jgi:hypothetical protein
MNIFNDILVIFRFLVLVTGFVDAIKYKIETNKIKKNQSSRNVSRLFTVLAIICDIILLGYVILIKEPTLFIVRLMSLYFMCELYWWQYIYYPYKCKGLNGWKRPNLWKFLVNSLQPNKTRKRL